MKYLVRQSADYSIVVESDDLKYETEGWPSGAVDNETVFPSGGETS